MYNSKQIAVDFTLPISAESIFTLQGQNVKFWAWPCVNGLNLSW